MKMMIGSGLVMILWVMLLSEVRAELPLPAAQVEAAWTKWAAEIAKLKAKDALEKHPEKAVLFLGSSSVRRWETIAQDMAPYHPIQRGYGGAKFADLVVFAEELIKPHQFQALVVYVGNDVVGKDTDATPEQVGDWFKTVAALARAKQPGADVFCVEITPTPSRWKAQAKIDEVNAVLKTVCEGDRKLHFVQTSSAYLNEAKQPRRELFVKDMLHQNAAGYKLWASKIKAALAAAGIPE